MHRTCTIVTVSFQSSFHEVCVQKSFVNLAAKALTSKGTFLIRKPCAYYGYLSYTGKKPKICQSLKKPSEDLQECKNILAIGILLDIAISHSFYP